MPGVVDRDGEREREMYYKKKQRKLLKKTIITLSS